MALVAPITGTMDALVKFAGGATDGLGKVVGESIADIRSAVNSFMDGPQISNALKDFDPIEDIGKFVGESIEDINSTVNSLMKGPQISNALKDFGSNYDNYFNEAMTTVLERVNAVADVISSDAEGSPLARGQVPQLRKPKLKFPETGVSALADVTSSMRERNAQRFPLTGEWWKIPKYKLAEEKGKDVVKEVVDIVTSLNLGSPEHGIMEKIAVAESRNGEHPGTYGYKNGERYFGGIWQVDKIGFEATQDTKSHRGLKRKYAIIKEKLGIDWTKVKWEDLTKPLYSGIAARLVLTLAIDPIPEDEIEQGVYYKKHYNRSGDATDQSLVDRNR
jgi:hypothetical protein